MRRPRQRQQRFALSDGAGPERQRPAAIAGLRLPILGLDRRVGDRTSALGDGYDALDAQGSGAAELEVSSSSGVELTVAGY